MLQIVRLETRRWSLARQLVVLQLCVVIAAVTIEAMVAVYRGPRTEQLQIIGLVALTEVALLVGIAGSLFVADRVRRQTFDMEPAEIARRYQHHDAMLHAVREGLIITDVNGDVVLANDEARRLLELTGDETALRAQLAGIEWATAQTPVTDQMQYAAGRVLMVSRSPASVDGEPAGTVTTLRDRTELQQALDQLSEARLLGDELRKQAHEHVDHLQMVIALIEMGQYEKAVEVCAKYSETPQTLSSQVLGQVADPVLASRLQVLHGRAERRGVRLELIGTLASVGSGAGHELADIVGNLVENAIDAAAERDQDGRVWLSIARHPESVIRFEVRDNGRGVGADPVERVFAPRWTTKGNGRGFGLALTRDKVTRLNGTITVHNEGGAVFNVCIPAVEE
jgi:two-component system CitB family sensor kinase